MASLSVYDHLSPTDIDYPDGIYRVVGTSGEGVTLLRVADTDGRRINTGEIITVSYDDLDGFDPAENPDGNRPLGSVLTSGVETVYWSVRIFVQQLAAHPLLTVLAFAFISAGYFGEVITPLPEVVLDILTIAGALGLAYIGSGRL
jgi:hypothetical protein